jgi:tetratricopeptide (TPR) repeat protein
MDDLLDLVDDHTEYFKSHLESLPAQERRVYLALARLWKPATTREISTQARLDINICSSLLKRLEGRGVVAVEGGTARRRQYYLTERLYNIYYLLRRDGGSNRVVDALVDFMTCFYSPAEVWDLTKPFLDRADDFGGMSQRATAYFATAMFNGALSHEELGQVEEALEAYDGILRRLGPDDGLESKRLVACLLFKKAYLFLKDDRGAESIAACDDLVNRLATHEDPLIREIVTGSGLTKGIALLKDNQIAEAVSAFDKVVMQFEPAASPDVASFVLLAIVVKTTFGEAAAMSEKEVSILLNCQEREDELQWGVIEALTKFSASAGAKRTLELIQGSEAAPLLLPLVTALQQELGQVTHVAKEVDEVAGDVRQRLVQIASSVQVGTPTVRATLTVTNPSNEPAEC